MVTAITGASYGDEGKGKMTDLLAEQADIVARFQGGANAGHTIVNDASPKFELVTSALIVGFTERNMGIGCVVKDFAEAAIDGGSVKELKIREPLPKRNICIVRDSDMLSVADRLLDMIMNRQRVL